MFGHQWEPAQATIVAVHIKNTSGDGTTVTHEFAADVVPASGVPFRAHLDEPNIATNFWAPSVGDVVKVHADVERQKAKFDKSDPKFSYKAWKAGNDADFQSSLTQPPAAPVVPIAERAAAASARLAGLKALRDQGVVTDDEYEAKRRAIIGGL
jgi:hypothetical protein